MPVTCCCALPTCLQDFQSFTWHTLPSASPCLWHVLTYACRLMPICLQDLQKETILAPGKFDVMVTSYEMVIK